MSKKTMNSIQFEETMGNNSYTVQDTTQESSLKNSTIEESYSATSKDQAFKIEYYIFDSETSAQAYFTQKKEETALYGSSPMTELNQANYSKYVILDKTNITYISRIGHTIAYCQTDKKYSEEVKKAFLDLGY